MHIPRKDWLRGLTAHPAAALVELSGRLSAGWTLTYLALPQAGLGLLKLRDGAFHEPYYLGEFPIACCRVRVQLPDGATAEGAAQVMADDPALAQALAVLDAILAARLPGWQEVAALANEGASKRAEEDRRRRAMLAGTRVDFALLGATEEDEDEY